MSLPSTPSSPSASSPPLKEKVLYRGAAGLVSNQRVQLFGLEASGNLIAIMAGSPSNPPSAEDMARVSNAGTKAFGFFQPWMIALIAFVVILALGALHVPAWVTLLLGIAAGAFVVGQPAFQKFQAFKQLFASREEVTLMMGNEITNAMQGLIEVSPESKAQKVTITKPTGIVVKGLPLPERIKLAGAVTMHTIMNQAQLMKQSTKK